MESLANVLLDDEGRIRSWSARARALWGREEAAVLGRDYSCLFADRTGGFQALLAEAGAAGEASFAASCACGGGRVAPARGLITADGDGGYALVVHCLPAADPSGSLEHDPLYGIIASAMDAVITVDERQRVVLFNAAAEKMFGCAAADALGGSLDRFLPGRYRGKHRGHVRRFGKTGTTNRRMGGRMELYGLRGSGEEFPIDASISQVTIAGARYYTAIVRDVTELRRAEERIVEERDTAQRYLDVAGVMFVALDALGRVTLVNRRGCEVLGWDEEEILGECWFDRFLPESARGATREVFRRLMSGEADAPAFHENPVRTRHGTERMMAWHNTLLRDAAGAVVGSLSSGEDVTERKRAQQALERSYEELRELSAAMHGVREAERTRIARELHDELAQWLTAIKMDVAWLGARLPKDRPELTARTAKMKEAIDTAVGSLRRIAAALRPVMLDDLGLLPSIEHLLHDLSERAGLIVSLDDRTQGLDLRDPLATAIYRMVQEALTNVARHARAAEVGVTLVAEGGELRIRVADNGVGLPAAAPARSSYGLAGIRERARTLGGEARIYSPEAGGTVVDIAIPLERNVPGREERGAA